MLPRKWAVGTNASVNALAVDGTGRIYVGVWEAERIMRYLP